MFVEKRDGTVQLVDFNKIMSRIKYLSAGVEPSGTIIGQPLNIDYVEIAKSVCGALVNKIKTNQLDELAGETCAYRIGEHPDYGQLASRIVISNHHKNTEPLFSKITENLYFNVDKNNQHYPLVTQPYFQFITENSKFLDDLVMPCHANDYKILDYFGFKTLYKSYLQKYTISNPGSTGEFNKGTERYQHLLMRQAVYINMKSSHSVTTVLENIRHCYSGLTQGLYTHATPTMLNSGKKNAQLSSCFLLGMDDSVDGMYNCVRNCSHISYGAGGIGIHLHDIRCNGSIIRGTGGKSDGIGPLAKSINSLAVHINQGGARPGAIALYLEPWHGDIFDFLELKLPSGLESRRARDLFYGLWVPDLFMERVKRALSGEENVMWSLMCPDQCPRLSSTYGDEFNKLYESYEREGKYIKRVDIMKVWNAILTCQRESGTPYMCYKDHVNRKSAQSNIGVIKSSNLCAEIVEYSDHQEYATCNLGSINLKKMVSEGRVNYQLLHQTAYQLTKNLNHIIDINKYPVPETSRSNFKHRPIGMGVTGLADVFMLLNLSFDCPEARKINKYIFETIYHGALTASCDLARERTSILSTVPLDILRELKKSVSMIEYYDSYFHNMKILAIDIETASFGKQTTYSRNFNDNILCHNTANNIISIYGLPPLTYEYGYMNVPESNGLHDNQLNCIGSYSSFEGSPASRGLLQYHLWKQSTDSFSGMWNFDELVCNIKHCGLRNSLTTAIMPTATTAQILGNVECIEPITSNLYSRQTLAGSFMIANQYLQRELISRGIWSESIKDKIILGRGSVQRIAEIPHDLKQIFRTVWEISKKSIIDMAADRGPFIDQSQSLNIFTDTPTNTMIQSIHFHGWERGLKTGMYYLRVQPPVFQDQFTVSIDKSLKHKQDDADEQNSKRKKNEEANESMNGTEEILVCRRDNPNCTSCGV